MPNSSTFVRRATIAIIAVSALASPSLLPGVSAARTDDSPVPAPASPESPQPAQAPTPETPPAEPAPAPPKDEKWTGIVIDARHLPEIMRSPAPTIYGPAPEDALIYPDRKHLPDADYLQEKGIVRYYPSEEAMKKAGIVGDNPLIVPAVEVLGPAKDGLRVSTEGAEQLRNADKICEFTRNWKVAFLMPPGK